MKIPKIISKNNREYIFVQKNNDKVYLYKEMITGYRESFQAQELGLVKEVVVPD